MISSFYEKIVGGSPPAGTKERKILCVGLSCLDIVHVCKHYPIEDSDERCQEYKWQRGGNASNNCTVLSKLGAATEFFGSLGDDNHNWGFIKEDMKKLDIDFSHCPIRAGIGCPTSTVILTLDSASRTILHYNPNMPELELDDMKKLDLDNYSWIHFEGRNVSGVISMMQYIESRNNVTKMNEKNRDDDRRAAEKMSITMSVELEKNNVELLDLLPYADVVFISKDFAKSRGCCNISETLKNFTKDVKSGAVIICAWGDRGAMAKTPDGTIVQSPAFSPPEVIDTLGAGDTFTAATLYYLNMVKLSREKIHASRVSSTKMKKTMDFSLSIDENKSLDGNSTKCETTENNSDAEDMDFFHTGFIDRRVLQGAVTFACRVAGSKVGTRGYDGISRAPEDLLSTSC